jgi:antirestriction protein
MVHTSLNNFCPLDNPESTIRIYVACLAAYSSGYLHGRWINATQPVDNIHQEIRHMLSKSPIPQAEEWAIHDAEGFAPANIGEYACIQTVHEKACFIAEHQQLGALLLQYYDDVEDATEALSNYYHGEHESELHFAIDLFDAIYLDSCPENLKHYIDYDAFCRDIFIETYFSLKLNGYVHVFEYH